MDSAQDLNNFSELFERSSKLREILEKLPPQAVLESGLSGKRNSLVESWSDLETPGLDGEVSSKEFKDINRWIHESEITISHIVNNVNKNLSLEEAGDPLYLELISDISEIEFASDDWCWPWTKNKYLKRSEEKFNKGRMIKYAAIASLATIAIISFLDEE